jgi:hypothetical protein
MAAFGKAETRVTYAQRHMRACGLQRDAVEAFMHERYGFHTLLDVLKGGMSLEVLELVGLEVRQACNDLGDAFDAAVYYFEAEAEGVTGRRVKIRPKVDSGRALRRVETLAEVGPRAQ